MKAVLDTNVVVSGLISEGGPCGQILGLAFDGALHLCVDDRILAEYQAVLPRPRFGLLLGHAAETLETIRLIAEPVVPLPLGARLPDPSDLPFLEVAAACEAVLVTGNLRHFPARARAGVTVVNPRGFLNLLGGC